MRARPVGIRAVISSPYLAFIRPRVGMRGTIYRGRQSGDPYPCGSQMFEHFYLTIETAIAGVGAVIGREPPRVAAAVQSGS
ncbi:hypothetical protein IE4803_PC00577 (plasmid) [Rhizobium etli bv. phaseoli str. IE4803]|nr:hypothetical protein IE4803_PC00577 [Rhizobium etli bv. phaseoli str. IE4803]